MINPRSIATLGIGYSPYAIASLGIYFDGSIIIRPSKPFEKPIWITDANFLQPTGFIFTSKSFPNISFHCTKIEIPSIQSLDATFSAPMVDYGLPSYKIETSSVTITFIVDENLINFNEILKWFNDTSVPNFEDRAFIDVYRALISGNTDGMISDATIAILTNNNNPNIYVELIDMYPISVGEIVTQTLTPNIQTCDVEFSVSRVKISANNT